VSAPCILQGAEYRIPTVRKFSSHGSGRFERREIGALGEGVVIEDDVLIFRPEGVHLGDNVYVGHRTQLKTYPEGGITVERDTWIGPNCFFSGSACITIGAGVGIGPGVHILTSTHRDPGRDRPIMDGELQRAPVTIGAGADIGVGSILLPGVNIGNGVQIGAGSVVTTDVPDYAVAAGSPARVLRLREE